MKHKEIHGTTVYSNPKTIDLTGSKSLQTKHGELVSILVNVEPMVHSESDFSWFCCCRQPLCAHVQDDMFSEVCNLVHEASEIDVAKFSVGCFKGIVRMPGQCVNVFCIIYAA